MSRQKPVDVEFDLRASKPSDSQQIAAAGTS